MNNCKICGNPINSNNRHRNYCYACKVRYPYKHSPKGMGLPPFDRHKLHVEGTLNG